jgi:agmatinase
MTQMGIRNVSSSNRKDYEDARTAGSNILSVRAVRRLGTEGVLELIPKDVKYYITIDIDGFDPSIAPGTGTPSHGGFLYYEVVEIIQGIVRQGNVIGMDLVEVSPPYDPANVTSILAAQVLMNALGYIFQESHPD